MRRRYETCDMNGKSHYCANMYELQSKNIILYYLVCVGVWVYVCVCVSFGIGILVPSGLNEHFYTQTLDDNNGYCHYDDCALRTLGNYLYDMNRAVRLSYRASVTEKSPCIPASIHRRLIITKKRRGRTTIV